MKFNISKEKFVEGLNLIQHVVTTRTTLPILSNVLLEARDGRLRLTTTDLDVGVTGSVEADIEKEGATTLPARKLASIIRELPADNVSVSVDSKHVAEIKSGPSFFKILGLTEEEFPPPPGFENAREFVMPQALLRDGLKKTGYAISTDESRYVLNGIYFSFANNTLTLVATDGRRLAMADYELEFPESNACNLIVPNKAISELLRLLKDDGDVKVSITQNQICFELGGTTLYSKLIEGNYPNFRQVIPDKTVDRITLERETFLETVHRISLLCSDKSHSIKLVFRENNIDVTINSPDVGEARESLPVSYKGAEFAIAFNPDFLMAPLRNLDTDEVYLDLIDEMSPGVIKINSPFLYVLMPVRVS